MMNSPPVSLSDFQSDFPDDCLGPLDLMIEAEETARFNECLKSVPKRNLDCLKVVAKCSVDRTVEDGARRLGVTRATVYNRAKAATEAIREIFLKNEGL